MSLRLCSKAVPSQPKGCQLPENRERSRQPQLKLFFGEVATMQFDVSRVF